MLVLRFVEVDGELFRKPEGFLSRFTDKHTSNSEAKIVGFVQVWTSQTSVVRTKRAKGSDNVGKWRRRGRVHGAKRVTKCVLCERLTGREVAKDEGP